MTEKHYGGASNIPQPKNVKVASQDTDLKIKKPSKENPVDEDGIEIDFDKLKKAGEIAQKAKIFAKEIVKPGVLLLDIANKIEDKIIELGGKPAFPVNCSINEIAAHATPTYNDETKATGLLKVDLGVHIEGYVADTALSFDLDNSEENKKLISAAQEALDNILKTLNPETKLNEIGKEIEDTIKKKGFQPIINLSGHSIDLYDLHSGLTIPNYDNFQETEIGEGLFAIEPFATSGVGRVKDGRPSGIYHLQKEGQVRDPFAREVLDFIKEEYQTLPFCSRWLVKKFGTRALIAIKRMQEAGLLHSYAQLIEESKHKVAQAEHTIILNGKEKIITT